MYNRYRGSGGRPQRMEDNLPPERPAAPAPKIVPMPKPGLPLAGGSISALLPKNLGANLSELETEDFLLMLILYLMYRESGDKELLLILGAMYLF